MAAVFKYIALHSKENMTKVDERHSSLSRARCEVFHSAGDAVSEHHNPFKEAACVKTAGIEKGMGERRFVVIGWLR